MSNPYLDLVQTTANLFSQGKDLPLGSFAPAPATPPPHEDAPRVMLFSPHPDDECITGLLPLRLMREAGFRILNVPVTFGSNPDRQAARAVELRNACAYIGFECLEQPAGDPAAPYRAIEAADAARLLLQHSPEIVFVPHAQDWNSRHISTHHRVFEALRSLPQTFACTLVETEFWGAMDDPNLMVEGDVDSVADLVAATSFHVEEVRRNPYHLRLAAWMQDNVRRGGELVGGQGGQPPSFAFATLYRLGTWRQGAYAPAPDPRMLTLKDHPREILA